jgi:hypothetical protein
MGTDLVRYTDLDGAGAQKFLQNPYAAMDELMAKNSLRNSTRS